MRKVAMQAMGAAATIDLWMPCGSAMGGFQVGEETENGGCSVDQEGENASGALRR